MRITTRSEYALRALFDLSSSLSNTHVVRLADISKRQKIPASYLKYIFNDLRKAKIVASLIGPAGGYSLVKPMKDITILEVMQAVGDKPLGRPKSQKTTTREANKVNKILELGDKTITELLSKNLGDF